MNFSMKNNMQPAAICCACTGREQRYPTQIDLCLCGQRYKPYATLEPGTGINETF